MTSIASLPNQNGNPTPPGCRFGVCSSRVSNMGITRWEVSGVNIPLSPLVAQAKMIYGYRRTPFTIKIDRSRQLLTYLGLIINGQSCRL